MDHQPASWPRATLAQQATDARWETVRRLDRAAEGRERAAAYAALQGVQARAFQVPCLPEICDSAVLTLLGDARDLYAVAADLAAPCSR